MCFDLVCWVPYATAAGVLTNASSDACPLLYAAGVCTIDVTQILAPMLLQIYDTSCARECNETRCSTFGFEANGAMRAETNNRVARSHLTDTAHAFT